MKNYSCLLAFIFTLLAVTAFSQGRAKLENERKKLMADIEFTQKLLDETSKDRQHSITQLETLKQQIKLREKVIANVSKDLTGIDLIIAETNDIIESLVADLANLKVEYAKMVYNVYKNRSTINQVIFIFSAKSFNDALQRIKYIQQYSEFRKRQAEMILETKKTLSRKNQDQEEKKKAKETLLETERNQQLELDQEKKKKNELLTSLQEQEKELKKKMKKKEEAANKLNKKIEEIIKREIAAAKKAAEKAAALAAEKETKKDGNVLSQTPEAAKLSADFASNQGRLPWPVGRGIISSTFGEHPHPVLKYVKIVNNGIDIKTNENAKVRTVFDGTVISVVYNPGFQRAVIVRHGEYFTVYSNLGEVTVRSGDNISMKQNIGTVFTDEDEGKTEVHFEVWKGTEKLNPALWIYSNNP